MKNRQHCFPSILVTLLILGAALFSLYPINAGAASYQATRSLILYDAASGAIPSAPLMGFLDFPQNAASLSYTDGVTVLDTMAAGGNTYAGWVATAAASPGFPILDRTAGFQVSFTVQVENETHASDQRAGFSFIVLSQDGRGIELGFWEEQIWAQADDRTGGLFTRGEEAAFATSAGLTEYQVMVAGETYTLTANGESILTGPMRDYSTFTGFPDPYETPNFLFLGDDTTSAQARVRLSFVSVLGSEPVAATLTGVVTDTPFIVPSSTPPSGVAPVPSPTPAGTAMELCPSAWIFLAVMLAISFVAGNFRIE